MDLEIITEQNAATLDETLTRLWTHPGGWGLLIHAAQHPPQGARLRALRERWDLRQLGADDIDALAHQCAPSGLLIVDNLIPAARESLGMPDAEWDRFFDILMLAMARADQGLRTLVLAPLYPGYEEQINDLAHLPGCELIYL